MQDEAASCWRLVRQCSWVTYNTVCGLVPSTECEVSPVCYRPGELSTQLLTPL